MLTYSVIIPVYKVEKYLPACIDSVLAQDTASEYEIILVDDGSPDGSGAICDEYAAKHEHIRVIHQPNSGVSVARNTGIDAARGEYLLFLDSDDLWKPGLLSELNGFLDRQPDMTLFCYETFTQKGTEEPLRPALLPGGQTGEAYLQAVFSRNELPFIAVWTYLYRREFLLANGFRFCPGMSHAEDMEFNYTCLPAAGRVCGTDRALLRYRLREDSVSATPSAKGRWLRLQSDVKWYGRYPVTPLANYFALAGLGIAAVGDPVQRRELADYYFQHAHIASKATGKARFAYRLLRLFGIRAGTALFQTCVKAKHLLRR